MNIEGNLKKARFIKRINRFIGEISVDGEIHKTHIANTGRMKELLTENARVIVRHVENEKRKTAYDLLMVYKGDSLVSIDSKLPNILLEKAFLNNHIHAFRDYTAVKKEVTFGKSRFDLFIHRDRHAAFIEAKCVTYVREDQVASFPDAPTERGRKHVLELIEVLREGMRGAVYFIVQREDAIAFTPNRTMDPLFADAVEAAYQAGVEFYAFTCKVAPEEILIYKEIPIFFS
ncbi:sugar fermentation stimulation protein SfsA [Geosporobacter ferrireducens]|uniref:Sugar fermentation stimulation protein homolog n=1 Tax=Geosporobacter ferrireducens TaxID=1424294 RepID=A0A1D8GR13_9FIRM|nr:sugar fermentation stimulation protein SfsA [Geosporobacter ferrireducens]